MADDDKKELTADAKAQYTRYWREIERYDRATQDWRNDGENIVDLYLAQIDAGRSSTQRKFPLLWANVETLKPAIYAKMPVVQCTRRFKDRDPIGRVAGEILERAANTTFDLYGIDEIIRMVRDDRLLPGRGQAWVRYEPSFETVDGEAPPTADAENAAPATSSYERLKSEKVCVDYVHWTDFGHSLARTWHDVRLVWRRVYKTYDEVRERFGDKIADALPFTEKAPDEKEVSGYKACIYEIWDKTRGKVVWLAKEYQKLLEEGRPPLDFMDFFPCPEPCFATKTSKSLIPTPDYTYYRDQAKEINDLTVKISVLTDWLKLQGFVPGAPSSEGPDAIKRLVSKITDSNALLVEVESWAAFTEKGGSKMIDWLPIQHIIMALRGAIEARAQMIQDVFQITGISDILRGQTDPGETLGAQELKAQTGSRRLKNTRDEIVRFSRDIARLVCEVIAEHFQPETLAAISGFKYMPAPPPGAIQMQPGMQMQAPQPPPLVPPNGMQMMGPQGPPPGGPQPGMAAPQGAVSMMGQQNADQPEQAGVFGDEVIKVLRDDRLRSFRIDIETDSTVQADEDAEKQRAIEFLGAVGNFVKEAVPVLQAAPAMAPALGESLLFLVRRMRAGRQLEETIEKSVTQMSDQIKQQAQQPRPDPEMAKAQAKAEIDKKLAEQALQLNDAKAASERKIAEDKAANERNIALLTAQNDMKIATMKGAQEAAHKERAAADEKRTRDEGAKQELDLKRKSVEAGPEIEAAKELMERLPELVAATSEKMVAAAMDKVEERVKAIKFPPRVRRPKYDKNGNIVEVREQDEVMQ